MNRDDKWTGAAAVRRDVERAVAARFGRDRAEDSVAEAVSRIDHADVETQEELAAWLYAVAVRVAIDACRADASRTRAEVREGTTQPATAPAAEEEAITEQERQRAAVTALRLLGLLPDRQRRAVVLRDALGEPVEHVAAALGTSYKGTESLLSRARSALRDTARHALPAPLAAFGRWRRERPRVWRTALALPALVSVLWAVHGMTVWPGQRDNDAGRATAGRSPVPVRSPSPGTAGSVRPAPVESARTGRTATPARARAVRMHGATPFDGPAGYPLPRLSALPPLVGRDAPSASPGTPGGPGEPMASTAVRCARALLAARPRSTPTATATPSALGCAA